MRVFHTILIGLSLFLFTGAEVEGQGCRPEKLIKACKRDLSPYTYSNSRSVMTKKAASREISVSLLKGESYRLVFHIANLPDEAVIRIYDGPKEDSGRDLLMSSRDIPKNRRRFLYDPPNQKGEDIYVSYDIPEPKDMACFTFVVGYQLSFTDQ